MAVVLLAALPLRGYAALVAELCASHHGGAQAEHSLEHDHESGHDAPAQDHDHGSTTSICSHCASCSVGASFAPDLTHGMPALVSGTDRIPFFDVRKAAHIPDHLDRPPLVS